VRTALTALALALFLAAAVTLTGCGPARQAPAQQGPAAVSPADVQQQEDEVTDIERVVGSAEAEAGADAHG
jgi:hypothetical protein